MTARRLLQAMASASGRGLGADRRGSIVILSALSLIALVAASAVALDLARLYLAQSTAQRVADQSALAAAFAYSQSSNSTATARQTATNQAVANGAAAATLTTTIVDSPSGSGNKAAMVVVAMPVPLSPFEQAATSTREDPSGVLSVTVGATAYAEIHSEVPPCIVALGGAGIGATGGTRLTATSCAVASGGGIAAASGPSLTAQALYAVGAISATDGSSIQSSPATGQLFANSSAPVDPYAGAGVFSRISTVAGQSAPLFPSIGGAPSGGSAQTCSAASSTLAIAPGTTVGAVSTTYYPSCTTIDFIGGAGTTTSVSGGLSLGGGNVTLNFGPGTYKIGNGITTGGSTAITVNVTGAATFEIWPNSAECGSGYNAICISGSSTFTVHGPATFYLVGGITNNSGGPMVFDNANSASNGASTSTFYVSGGIDIANGPGTFPNGLYSIASGDAAEGAGIDVNGGSTATFGDGGFDIAGGIYVGGGGHLTLGGQINSNAVFQIPTATTAAGGNDYAIYTGGGSTLTLGGFPNVDINGAVTIQGNFYPGAGTFTLNGALDAASAGGCCIGGTGVSIVTAGTIAFGAGYSTVSLSAPSAITATTLGTPATIALASESAAASSISAGASNTSVLGAIYLPNAPLTLGGAGNLSGGGGCLVVVSGGITLSGSGTIATDCPSLGNAATAASVALVQ